LAILILGRPNDEIVDLCNKLNIEIVWPIGDMFISTNHSIFEKNLIMNDIKPNIVFAFADDWEDMQVHIKVVLERIRSMN
jgi:hypothetical protein